jgi:hypothetical protein
MDASQAAYYLAAMIDGEGHVNGPAAHGRCIEIANTERDIIDATLAACLVLGITPKHRWKPARERRKAACIIRISGIDNLVRVRRLVPIQSARKSEALSVLLSVYTKKTVLPLAEELAAMYHGGMSLNEIAKRHSVGIHTIMHRLKSHGIQFRTRGEASRLGQLRQGGVAA